MAPQAQLLGSRPGQGLSRGAAEPRMQPEALERDYRGAVGLSWPWQGEIVEVDADRRAEGTRALTSSDQSTSAAVKARDVA